MNEAIIKNLKAYRFLLHACALTVLFFISGCQTQPAGFSESNKLAIDRLLQLVDERLAVAPIVARSKWNSGASINAPEREAKILQQVVQEAEQSGVGEQLAHDFFQSQFEASKVIQRRLHQQWQQEARPPFETSPDLATEVRPVLDRLTPQLIVSLGDFQRVAQSDGATQYLEQRSKQLVRNDFEGEPREVALHPLFEATN